MPDGTSLKEAIGNEPQAYLGPEHVARFGADVALLVKLLDAGERLPVHFHPDDAFAWAHLGSPFGKTEAWIILEADRAAAVRVGFGEEPSAEVVAGWVERQDTKSMLGTLRRLPVSAGDTIFVPAGTPHAIGDGILLAELQQPTDFSVLLEWGGFAIDGPNAGHLGLGFDLALEALDRSPWSDDDLARARSGRAGEGGPVSRRCSPPRPTGSSGLNAFILPPRSSRHPSPSFSSRTATGASRVTAGASS